MTVSEKRTWIDYERAANEIEKDKAKGLLFHLSEALYHLFYSDVYLLKRFGDDRNRMHGRLKKYAASIGHDVDDLIAAYDEYPDESRWLPGDQKFFGNLSALIADAKCAKNKKRLHANRIKRLHANRIKSPRDRPLPSPLASSAGSDLARHRHHTLSGNGPGGLRIDNGAGSTCHNCARLEREIERLQAECKDLKEQLRRAAIDKANMLAAVA